MLTVYVDMDGVLANFDKPWNKFLEENKGLSNNEAFRVFTEDMRMFKELEPESNSHSFINGLEFLAEKYYCMVDLNIEILSCLSTQTPTHRAAAFTDKVNWLQENQLEGLTVNFVNKKEEKAKYATPNSFLIDDNPRTIAKFIIEGGEGVIHRNDDFQHSLDTLEAWLIKKGEQDQEIWDVIDQGEVTIEYTSV